MPDETVTDALEVFRLANEAESENRRMALDDLTFARLSEQWPEDIKKDRERDGRPCLTANRLPAFIRQVVNEARQNTPQINVRPVDGGADVETAKVMNGMIRNIEATSNADVAYDTAADFAVSMGWGYIQVDVDFSHDDTFQQDILIKRVANPFSVWGDPFSDEADSSDWNNAFVLDALSKEQFEQEYPNADEVDFNDLSGDIASKWVTDETVTVADWWSRSEVSKKIFLLSNGMVVDEDRWEESEIFLRAQGAEPVREREVLSYQVTHRTMTGSEVLDETEWPGKFIPIIPVYGDEVNVEGTRYYQSLIRDAKDSQRMFNYWRTTSTELVALAPKAPFIGPKGFAKTDRDKWESANTVNWPYLEYDGNQPPQRQPFDGLPAGALSEALAANDDMKSIMGIHDASLGLRGNETSGIGIAQRKQQGDVATFHFIDNLARAVRHTGNIIVDLIPQVYSGQRVIRTLGQDGTTEEAQLAPFPGEPTEGKGNWSNEVYDLSVGKYDLVVDTGPSFATQREEAAAQMMELLTTFPQAAPIIGDLLVKNLDWPGSDEIAERLQALVPGQDQEDPRLAQMQGMIQQLQGALQQALDDQSIEQAKVAIDQFDAETKRIKALADAKNQADKLVVDARGQAANTISKLLN